LSPKVNNRGGIASHFGRGDGRDGLFVPQLRDLGRAIAALPEEQRQVILLIGLEAMKYEEVAQILDIPIGTVRSRLSRGRDMLRQLMGIKEDMVMTDAVARLPARPSGSEQIAKHAA
jgi:hypothetical protein